MREEYVPELYINLIEHTENTALIEYMREENEIIKMVKKSKTKTFIELGAGYGRLVPVLASLGREVFGIEMHHLMFKALERSCQKFSNSVALQGDILKLNKIKQLKKKQKVVFVIAQNTLGAISGEWEKVIKEIADHEAESKELVLSLFRAEALPKEGMKIYKSLKNMLGEPDNEKISFQTGMYHSVTEYSSKWWFDEEIDNIIVSLNAKVLNERRNDLFRIVHLKF